MIRVVQFVCVCWADVLIRDNTVTGPAVVGGVRMRVGECVCECTGVHTLKLVVSYVSPSGPEGFGGQFVLTVCLGSLGSISQVAPP